MTQRRFQIVRGAVKRPHAIILTGRSGIGKTYFASTIPDVFFVCLEQGLMGASPEHIETLPRFEAPKSLVEAMAMVDEFRQMAKSEGYRHLVLDSLSGLERLVNLQVCQTESVAHMEAKDFARLWTEAMPIWQRIQSDLDRVRDEARVHVWVIAHSQEVREIGDADGNTFAKLDLAMQGSGKSVVELRQIWRAWADEVLFLDWKSTVTKGANIGQKSMGRYEARVLYCRESPRRYAKSRAALPDMIPAAWVDLERAMRAGSAAPEKKLRADIAAAAGSLSEGARHEIEAAAAKAVNAPALSAVLSRARGMIAVAEETGPVLSEEPYQIPSAEAATPVHQQPERDIVDELIRLGPGDDDALASLATGIDRLSEDERAKYRDLYTAARARVKGS